MLPQPLHTEEEIIISKEIPPIYGKPGLKKVCFNVGETRYHEKANYLMQPNTQYIYSMKIEIVANYVRMDIY